MSKRAVLAVWLLLTATVQAAELDLPLEATVTASSVYVRSGPGEDYYPTEKLRAGDRVYVVREGRRGWLAIRPTRESYNWVSARYVREVEHGMLEVTGDNVALRIGSDLTNDRDVYQVVLRRGDRIEMIDRVGTGSNAWYRVSPPDGDVRWIHRDYLDLGEDDAAATSSDVVRPLAAPQLQPAAYHRSSRAADQAGYSKPRRLELFDDELLPVETASYTKSYYDDPQVVRASAVQPASNVVIGEPMVGEPVVTGPLMAPPMGISPTDPYWDPYCDCPPLAQGYHHWVPVAGAEATFVYPELRGSSSTVSLFNPFSGALASITRDGTLDNEWTAAPRVWIGVQRTRGIGIIGRYWQLGVSTQDLNANVSLGDALGTPVLADFLATERVSAWNADAELTLHWDWESGFGLNGSVGYRHAELEASHLTAATTVLPAVGPLAFPTAISHVDREFHGDGVTYSVGGKIPLGRGSAWHVFFALRGSNLWGTHRTDLYAVAPVLPRQLLTVQSEGTDMFIGEVQAGVQWESRLQVLPANAFVRVAFEYQNWSVGGAQGIAAVDFLPQPNTVVNATASANGDLELQLLGVAVAAGITY